MVEMRPYTRFNKDYHYIHIIDVLSKHAWVVPLKTKSGNEMTTVIAKIIRDDERCPKKYNINHYSIYSIIKASLNGSIVETICGNNLCSKLN